MSYAEIKNDIQKLTKEKFRLVAYAKAQNRETNSKEDILIGEFDAAIDGLKAQLEAPAGPALTVVQSGGNLMHGGGFSPHIEPGGLVPPGGKKDYRSLFGSSGYQWPDKQSNFFGAVFSGRHHPGLVRSFKNALGESVLSDGGALVPLQNAERIHAVSLENELVMPRAYVQAMTSNECKFSGMVIGDHSANLYGGFTASYTAEAGTIAEANPKTRAMLLNAKKLTGLIRFSAELDADTPNGMQQIETLCGKGLSWYRDLAFLKGTGAGMPMGILSSNCVVEVDPETGQDSSTVIFENLTKMMSRMFAGSFSNSVWVCHQTVIPQLLQLSIPVGVGGDVVPAMRESNGQFSILTRPVLFTEKTEPLGSRGDIMLADFSQYLIGLRSGMRFDVSIHPHFQTDELLGRLIERHDGQPLWDSPLTLEDGSTTVSPFVVLGERA